MLAMSSLSSVTTSLSTMFPSLSLVYMLKLGSYSYWMALVNSFIPPPPASRNSLKLLRSLVSVSMLIRLSIRS